MAAYQYAVCYEWTDNQGQTHRSAPSVALDYSGTAIDSSHPVDVVIPTLRLTGKQAPRSPVSLVVYRTEASGTIFYQASSITSPTFNTPGQDSIIFADSVTDAVLIGNPQLYTTGGVVENIAPNAVSSMTVYQNRLVVLDSTNPLQLRYSKQVIPGQPAEFSDLFTLNLDPRGGGGTAVATLDDKLIVFKETSTFFVVGQGPDSTGGNNDFSGAQQITSDGGCINPRSIVPTPAGLMYQSAKGIYLLNRSLQTSYVGADVEAYNQEVITSAQLVPNTNEVRFTLDSGIALVFDYLVDQWGVFTNLNAVDSALFQGLYTYLRPDGGARQETPGVFSDAGNFIKLRLVTSWLQMAGLQGFQRAYRFLVLGDYLSPHLLIARVAYDFDPTPLQQDTIDAGSLLSTNTYGSDATYGAESVYGGQFPRYQWRLHLAKQKCEAIQLSLEDASSDGSVGEGMNLSGFTLEIGVKQGAFKLPAARSVG